MNNEPIRLIIADDHHVMREGLVALLTDKPNLEVVAQASSGQEVIDLVRRLRPDIVLLDITMDDMTGLEAMCQFLPELPEVKVIILTMHEEEAFFFEAIRAGTSGYFLKGAHGQELLNAIQAVHMGGFYLTPKLTGSLVQEYLRFQTQSSLHNPLTLRESEVLTLIAQGLSNPEIAKQLVVSVNTIKTHRLRIYQKLNLNDRPGLVDYALRQGLLQNSPTNQNSLSI